MRRRLQRDRARDRKEVSGKWGSASGFGGAFFLGGRRLVADLKFGHYKNMESRPVEERRGAGATKTQRGLYGRPEEAEGLT